MKLVIVDSKNQEKGSVELPSQFEESVRSDLIHRAVVAMQSNRRQPYGSFELSGLQHSIDISKRRRDYKGVYGVGQSRTPRKILSRSGTRMNWVGANAPGMVGGRAAKEGHSIRYSRDCEQGDGAGAGPQDPFKVSCCCRLFIGISLKDKRCHQRVDRAWVWR